MHKKELSVLLVVGLFALVVLIIMMLPGVPKTPPGKAGYGLEECPAPNCILYEASIPPASVITNPDGTITQSMSSWDTFSCLPLNTYSSDGGFFCARGVGVISCGVSPTRVVAASDRAYHCRYLDIFTGIPPGSPGVSVSEGITTWYCDQYGQFGYDAQGVPIWFNVDKKPGKWTLTKPPNWAVDCGYVCKADSTRCEGSRQVVSTPGLGGQSAGNFGQVIRGTTLQTCNSRGSAYADTVCSGMCIETMTYWTQAQYSDFSECRYDCRSDIPPGLTEEEKAIAEDACDVYCGDESLYKGTQVQGSASCVACAVDADCVTGSCVSGQCTGAVPPPVPPVLEPKVVVTKIASAGNITAGELVTYTIEVISSGTDTAYNITVKEIYSSGVSFVSASPVPTSGNDTWFISSLAPNASSTISVVVNVTANATNLVNVTYAGSNGSSSATSGIRDVTVGPAPVPPATYANTSVSKTASVNGSIITYTIILSSTGTEPAVNVTVKETYASGLDFLSSIPAPTTGNDTWFFSSLAVNSSTVITITMNATVNGTFPNSVTVSYVGGSGSSASSTSSISTLVGPAPVPPPTPSGGGGGGGGGGGSRGGVLCPTYCIKDPKYSDPNYPGYVYIPICSSNACLAMSKVVQPSPPISTPAPSREIAKCGDSNKMYPEYCDPAGSACKDREGLDGTCAADCMSCVPTPAQVVEVGPSEVPVVEAPPVQPKAVEAKSKGWIVGIPLAVLVIAGVAYYYIRRRLLGMPL